jgi:hypothetical protein
MAGLGAGGMDRVTRCLADSGNAGGDHESVDQGWQGALLGHFEFSGLVRGQGRHACDRQQAPGAHRPAIFLLAGESGH